MRTPASPECDQSPRVQDYALGLLPAEEAAVLQEHLAACADCRGELGEMRRVIDAFAAWPTDVLRPSRPLWPLLAQRIAPDAAAAPPACPERSWSEPDWEQVAPGISCKLLATDAERGRVSMLVRLAPGTAYPPHSHAAVEELHLLEGELWIEDRKLLPGDYNRAEPGTSDQRVWSGTGCTCVLITSPADVLR